MLEMHREFILFLLSRNSIFSFIMINDLFLLMLFSTKTVNSDEIDMNSNLFGTHIFFNVKKGTELLVIPKKLPYCTIHNENSQLTGRSLWQIESIKCLQVHIFVVSQKSC